MRIYAVQPALGFGIGLSGPEGDEQFAAVDRIPVVRISSRRRRGVSRLWCGEARVRESHLCSMALSMRLPNEIRSR